MPGLTGLEVVVAGPLVGASVAPVVVASVVTGADVVGSVTGADVVVGSSDPSPMKEQLKPF